MSTATVPELPTTPEGMKKMLSDSVIANFNRMNQTFQDQQDLIKRKRDELFGYNGNLNQDQTIKVGQINAMINNYPTIIDPLLAFGASLVNAQQQNDAAVAADPTLVMRINAFIKSLTPPVANV